MIVCAGDDARDEKGLVGGNRTSKIDPRREQ
jgi:hypothetical protein